MGCRAIRICLRQPEIFKTTAARAFEGGSLWKSCYFVSDDHFLRGGCADLCSGKRSGRRIKTGANSIPRASAGIMIETPAAVMLSDELAEQVDFFSIGTNDLTQYTLAIDRQNPRLEAFCPPHHKAVLRMIQMVVDNAHKRGKWVGICGELGADLALSRNVCQYGRG